jgi:hypothetical protein
MSAGFQPSSAPYKPPRAYALPTQKPCISPLCPIGCPSQAQASGDGLMRKPCKSATYSRGLDLSWTSMPHTRAGIAVECTHERRQISRMSLGLPAFRSLTACQSSSASPTQASVGTDVTRTDRVSTSNVAATAQCGHLKAKLHWFDSCRDGGGPSRDIHPFLAAWGCAFGWKPIALLVVGVGLTLVG